jgi:hypothetical protein
MRQIHVLVSERTEGQLLIRFRERTFEVVLHRKRENEGKTLEVLIHHKLENEGRTLEVVLHRKRENEGRTLEVVTEEGPRYDSDWSHSIWIM